MYQVEYSALGEQSLGAIPGVADRDAIVRRVAELQSNPYRSRALRYGFEPYRRARAAGGRYRIFFAVDENAAVVRIEYIGMRNPGSAQDAYAVFERLLLENRL